MARKRGIFDPDYRLKGWNQSRYAPKNSSMSITQLATGIAFLLFFASYMLLRPDVTGFYILAGVCFLLWIYLGVSIRRREWARIQRKLAPEHPPTQEEKTEAYRPLPVKAATLHHRDFEHEVAWVINALTNYKAVVTGGAGDGGVDIKVYKGKQFVGIVQCKRYQPDKALPPDHVRALYGTKTRFGVSIAYLVTTAKFTAQTQKEARELGIKLIDGERFEIMRRKAKMRLAAIR